MTPTRISDQLTEARWNPVSDNNWTGPKGQGPHCYLVALMVADLPRMSNPASLEPSPEKIKRLVHLLKVRRVGATRAGKELGMSPEKVRRLYEKHRNEHRA